MTREELLNELQEQARLVGMGAERELALKAKVDRLGRVNAELLEALEFVIRGVPDTWEGVQKASAVIAKARGEK
jgi:hypothetical protein